MRQMLIILLLLVSISSCPQSQTPPGCESRIDQLYASQKVHLIFCSYYFAGVNNFSGADTILHNYLTFYRDTTDASLIKKQDNAIINNLKKGVCHRDTSLVTQMKKWCEVSVKVAEIIVKTDFTLEGYMDLLQDYRYTRFLVTPDPKSGRTLGSLSTNEMEWIYFSSISIIESLKVAEQNRFFNKMRSWKFI